MDLAEEILQTMQEDLSEDFPGDISIERDHNLTTVLVKNDPEAESLIKFKQLMGYLSFEPTWFFRTRHAAELVYESALVKLGIPFPAKHNQQTEFIHRPETGWVPLETFGGEQDVEKLRREHERLKACYEIIDRALGKRKDTSYRKREDLPQSQRTLYNFSRVDGDEDQVQFPYFTPPVKQSTRVERAARWRKVRFDVIYDVQNPKALVFAEVKAYHTLRGKLLNQRDWQMLSYDAWLVANGDEGLTPFLYILPTIPSHKEMELLQRIEKTTKRAIVPLCITTEPYLKSDMYRRSKVYGALQARAKKSDVDPNLLKTYEREHWHVQNQIGRLSMATV